MIRGFQTRRLQGTAALLWSSNLNYPHKAKSKFQLLIDLGFEAVKLTEMSDDSLRGLIDPDEASGQLNALLEKLEDWKESSNLIIQIGPLQDLNREFLSKSCTLKGFPQKMSRVAELGAYAYVHDMRLMQIYYTIRLAILMSLLENPQPADTYTPHEDTTMREEAARAADLVTSFAEILNPTLWPTYGYMFEIWSVETAIRWYQGFEADSSRSELEYYGQSHLDLCLAMHHSIKTGMKGQGVNGIHSPFRDVVGYSE